MPTKRPVRVARDLSVLSITGGVRNADGSYTWDSGSTISVLGHLRGYNRSVDATVKEISSDADPMDIDWNISDAIRGSLDVYEVNDGVDPQPLYTLALDYDWFKIVRTIGSGGSAKAETTIHSRGNYSTQQSGKEDVLCTLNLGSAGVIPTYA